MDLGPYDMFALRAFFINMASHLGNTISSFEMDSYIKGYHAYQDIWSPTRNKKLKAVPEPTNVVDKYAVCVLFCEEVVGHLKKGKTGRFAKTIFYFLKAGEKTRKVRVLPSFREKLSTLGMAKACKYPVLYGLKEQQNLSMCYGKSLKSATKRRNFDHVQ